MKYQSQFLIASKSAYRLQYTYMCSVLYHACKHSVTGLVHVNVTMHSKIVKMKKRLNKQNQHSVQSHACAHCLYTVNKSKTSVSHTCQRQRHACKRTIPHFLLILQEHTLLDASPQTMTRTIRICLAAIKQVTE
jgi:hypothetical protein